MDPKDVKLPIKVRWNIFIECFKKDEDAHMCAGIILLYLCGLGLALCVPSFMAGPISNFIMKFFFSILFSGAFIGVIAGGHKLWDEDLGPFVYRFSKDYKERILPLQKKALDEVDDILLK